MLINEILKEYKDYGVIPKDASFKLEIKRLYDFKDKVALGNVRWVKDKDSNKHHRLHTVYSVKDLSPNCVKMIEDEYEAFYIPDAHHSPCYLFLFLEDKINSHTPYALFHSDEYLCGSIPDECSIVWKLVNIFNGVYYTDIDVDNGNSNEINTFHKSLRSYIKGGCK